MISESTPLAAVEQAMQALLDDVVPLASESVALGEATGRVLAEAVEATMDVPPFDNSAMDGYALHHSDAGHTLPILGRVAAGDTPLALERGTCARIFTGGALPEGADCVVMQEKACVTDGHATLPGDVPEGDNVRRRGRDVAQGSQLLDAGMRLDAAALGHLAAQGIDKVQVRCKPRVALLSTGDEIIEPGKPLASGQIYNSNRPMLVALLEGFGADVIHIQHVPDNAEDTRRCLREAALAADIVVSTGGVSVGEEDHVKAALEALGELNLWRLAIRPGKPLALGRLPGGDGQLTRFVGLPGNPVSGYVGAWLFLRPLLGAMQGCTAMAELPRLWATSTFGTSTGPRQHYMRVRLDFSREGIQAHAFTDQNSGVLSSCVGADALAVVPPHSQVAQGDLLECLWLKA
ncbi:gephyrin-like molybdotransferase Glp [Halomonas cupida]|uniref:molybdopterin molybdotransferase MoeA n=1 Tax=Halomonas cupida TaxID=44933 RepID=UPI003A943D1B